MLQALLSHHLVVFVPCLEENTMNFMDNSFGRARLILLGLHPSIVSVRVSGLHSAMAIVFGSEFIKKVVGNHTREMFVDGCRLWLYGSPVSIVRGNLKHP